MWHRALSDSSNYVKNDSSYHCYLCFDQELSFNNFTSVNNFLEKVQYGTRINYRTPNDILKKLCKDLTSSVSYGQFLRFTIKGPEMREARLRKSSTCQVIHGYIYKKNIYFTGFSVATYHSDFLNRYFELPSVDVPELSNILYIELDGVLTPKLYTNEEMERSKRIKLLINKAKAKNKCTSSDLI